MTIGFDLGSYNCVASVTRRGVTKSNNMLDITLDEGSKRSVPPMVTFPSSERLFGNMSKNRFKKNANITVVQPQKLIGVAMEDVPPAYRGTVSIVANPTPTTGGVTTPMYKIPYQGNADNLIHPVHATACILKHQTKHALERTQGTECCIVIPNNASYAKREGLMAAAEIAGVQNLKLVSSTSSLCHDLGLLGGKSSSEIDVATLFLDCGHSGVNIGVVKFFNGGWDIVAQDTFEQFSGALMEMNMMTHFAEQFKAQNGGEDFTRNAGATQRVKNLIPKLLKTLVVDEVAKTSIDYLYADCDFDLSISREEIWGYVQAEVQALAAYLRDFLGLAKEKLKDVRFDGVELVGGVSRMVDLKAMLSELCGEVIGVSTLHTHLNTDEAPARGCVLQAAVLSPRFGIQSGKVRDTVPYSVLVGRQPIDYDPLGWRECTLETLFPTFHELNKTKTIKFKKPRPLMLMLVEQTARGEQRLIGWASIDTSGESLVDTEEWNKFQILVSLDHSGLVTLRAEITKSYTEMIDVKKTKEVELTEEEYAEAKAKAEEEARAKAEAEAKKKREEAAKAKKDADGDTDMAEEAAEDVDIEETELEIPPVVVPTTKTVTYTEQEPKKMFKKSDVAVNFVSHMGIAPSQIQQMKDLEAVMSAHDKQCLAVQAAKNDLESYVLEAQSEFADGGTFYEFMSEDEAENFMNSIFEAEEWVGDNEEESLETYVNKLNDLRAVGDVFEIREKEWNKRPQALTIMKKTLTTAEMWVTECMDKPEEFEYCWKELQELQSKIGQANAWLDERQQLSQTASKTQDPPYYATEVGDKAKELNMAINAVKGIKKPEPKKDEEEEVAGKQDGEAETADTKDSNTEMEDTEAAGDNEMEDTEA